jgi:membrane-bound inhibitor of C-type lysozyme
MTLRRQGGVKVWIKRFVAWSCVFCIAFGSAIALSTDVASAQVIHYVCADGQPMFVNYYNNGNAALVVHQDIRYGLHHQPQVQGARYSNGRTYWWWQGFSGTLGHESGPVIAWNCRQTTAGGVQPPSAGIPPQFQPPFAGGRTAIIDPRHKGGQVRLNVGDILKVRLAGQGWTVAQANYDLMHQIGTGGFYTGEELDFRAVNPGTFVLILQQRGSNARFTAGVTIGYGWVPQRRF